VWYRWLGSAAVEELDEQPGTVTLRGGGDATVAIDHVREVAAKRVRGQETGRSDGDCLHDDQPRAPLSARLLIGDKVGRREVIVDERGLMRRRNDAAAKLRRPDRERLHEVVECHCTLRHSYHESGAKRTFVS
jgi:hypothetical protein